MSSPSRDATRDANRDTTPTPRKRSVGRPPASETAVIAERIQAAARQLFLEQGYALTSLDQVAQLAGVHRDTLYRQHGNKEGLFRAVLSTAMGTMRAGVARVVGRGGPPARVLPRVARQLYASHSTTDTQNAMRIAIAEGLRFPALAEEVHANWRTDLAPLIDYLGEQRAAGSLTLDDPAEAAYAFATTASQSLRLLMAPPLRGAALQAHLQRTVNAYMLAWHADMAPTAAASITGGDV